ncbi:MAG: hypothetical protein LH649_14535 [Pseudanabaena sp. CAN_BIN31]|nr:hypothetical protein [Pseudanabaena sp. CAN_BIN31]
MRYLLNILSNTIKRSPYLGNCERRSLSCHLCTCAKKLAIVVGMFEAIGLVVGSVCDRCTFGFVKGDHAFLHHIEGITSKSYLYSLYPLK